MSVLLGVGVIGVRAAPLEAPDASGEQRAQIRQERRTADVAHADEQALCRAQFVVTSCLLDAAARHRATVAALRQREQVLADTERQRRAAERQREIAAKQEKAAQQNAPAVTLPAQPSRPALTPIKPLIKPPSNPSQTSAASASHAGNPLGDVDKPPSAQAALPVPRPAAARNDNAAAQRAQARVLAAKERQVDATAEQARVAQRLAQRQAGGRAAQPLPVLPVKPAASAASR